MLEDPYRTKLVIVERHLILFTFILKTDNTYNIREHHEVIRDGFSKALIDHPFFSKRVKIESVYMESDDKYLCFEVVFKGKSKKIPKLLKALQREIGNRIDTYPFMNARVVETTYVSFESALEGCEGHLYLS